MLPSENALADASRPRDRARAEPDGQFARPFDRDAVRREQLPRRAEQVHGIRAAQRAVTADLLERRPATRRVAQRPVFGVPQARGVQLGSQRRPVVRGRLDPHGHGRRGCRVGRLGAAIRPLRGVVSQYAGAARVRHVADHQPRAWRPQQRVGDRVQEPRQAGGRHSGVRRQPPAVTALVVQRRIHALRGDRLEGRPGGRGPGPCRCVQRHGVRVQGGQHGQCRQQRHRPARQRPGKLGARGMADPEPPIAVEVQRAADPQQPPGDALEASRLRLRRLGQLCHGGPLLCRDLVEQPGGGRRLGLVLAPPFRDPGIVPGHMRAASGAGEHRLVRRAAGVLGVGQGGDDAGLRPLVQYSHGVALSSRPGRLSRPGRGGWRREIPEQRQGRGCPRGLGPGREAGRADDQSVRRRQEGDRRVLSRLDVACRRQRPGLAVHGQHSPGHRGSADQRLPGSGTGLGPPVRVGVEQQETYRTGRQPAGPDGTRELRVRRRLAHLVIEPGLELGRGHLRRGRLDRPGTEPVSLRDGQACQRGQQRQRRGLPRGLLAAAVSRVALDAHAVPFHRGPGGEPVARRRLGDLYGGDTQPLGLESQDGDRHREAPDDCLHRRRTGPGPRLVIAGGEEHLMQLPWPRFRGRDPAFCIRDQRRVSHPVLARGLQCREELVSKQRREVRSRVGQQSPQCPPGAFGLDVGLPLVSRW